uniref:Uncharacterized protein n=1 Tax=Rhipicephalus zambeziensis TaxID=60191 RepID=A0A224Y8Z8_9ACAR
MNAARLNHLQRRVSLIPLMGKQSPGRFQGQTYRPTEAHHKITDNLNVGPSSAPAKAGCGRKTELEPRVDNTNKMYSQVRKYKHHTNLHTRLVSITTHNVTYR